MEKQEKELPFYKVAFILKGVIMSKKLKFYDVDLEYVNFLKMVDNKVTDSSKENLKNRRKFIGILIEMEVGKYVAPLSSPKEKHLKMKENIDFLKIDNGKYGAINFNNMFPVPKDNIAELNIEEETDEKYKKILENQLSWCNETKNKEKILKKAKKLYKLVTNKKITESIIERCCDFKLLEKKALEWNKK